MKHFKLQYVSFDELSPVFTDAKKHIPADRCVGFLMTDGKSYVILIDRDATPEQQHFTLRHELAHLVLDHLAATKPLFEIDSYGDTMFGEGWLQREAEADQYAAAMTDTEFTELMQYAV